MASRNRFVTRQDHWDLMLKPDSGWDPDTGNIRAMIRERVAIKRHTSDLGMHGNCQIDEQA
jgi:hypothetical protein